jgi:inorganic pyrophosphatase
MKVVLVKTIVEMPKGTKFKYELDKSNGSIKIDRPLAIPVPYNYGFVPDTLSEDGDPLDIFVISSEPIVPMASLLTTVVGVLECMDNGVRDDKLVGFILGDKILPKSKWYPSLKKYLNSYKKGFKVLKFSSKSVASDTYLRSLERGVIHD